MHFSEVNWHIRRHIHRIPAWAIWLLTLAVVGATILLLV
jgi:hypothetical protein